MQRSSVTPLQKRKGTKRKREIFEQNGIDMEIERKLKRKIQEIRKSVKKVKLFEIQRVVKKMKESVKIGEQARNEQLQVELEYLKHIDTERIAIAALKTKAKKDRFLANNDIFQTALIKLAIESPDRTNNRSLQPTVDCRVLSSKFLSKEIEMGIAALKKSLGDSNVNASAYKESKSIINGLETVEGSNGFDFDSIFQSEKSDSEEDSQCLSDNVRRDSEDSDSKQDDDDNAGKDTDVSVLLRHPKQQAQTESIAPLDSSKIESKFLPSLSVGFISAKSGSDWSDAEASIADGIRKNRRGQRARKAIWEKKYGRNANHLRQQREIQGGLRSGAGRNRNTTHLRSFSTKNSNPKLNVANNQTFVNRDYNIQPNKILTRSNFNEYETRISTTSIKALTEKPIHPSWEAKRKLKEKHSAAIVPSQGTKLTFD